MTPIQSFYFRLIRRISCARNRGQALPKKMIAATIYLSRGVQSLKHMFFIIVRAVLLSCQGYKELQRGRGDGRIRGNTLGARIYTYLMRARSCKKQLANCSPVEWLGQILLFKSHSHRAEMLLAEGISKEKCSRRLSRMHKHNPRIMYISKCLPLGIAAHYY